MTGAENSAQRIYQQLLDDIGVAVVEQNKAKYVEYFLLPHRLQTFEQSVLITTPSELEIYFDKLIDRLTNLDVPELTRHCTIANFKDENTVIGYHQTKLINRSLVILEDYFALSTLVLTGNVWKVSTSQYAEPEPSLPTRIAGRSDG